MATSLKAEYKFAKSNPEITECKNLLHLVYLYTRQGDEPTLALVEAAAKDVREYMNKLNG